MKYLRYIVLLVVSLLLCSNVEAKENVKLYLFYGDGCPHCASEKEFTDYLFNKSLEIEPRNCKQPPRFVSAL